MNIYDLIEFPSKEKREDIRSKYPIFSLYKQIPMNMLKKYEGVVVPCEFVEYEMTVGTWINEYNHLLFFMLIPLYHAIDLYRKMVEVDSSTEIFGGLNVLFYHYSETVAFYMDSTFEKSTQIFNSMFELKVEDKQGSFGKIIDEIKRGAKTNKIFNEVAIKFAEINKNQYYSDISYIRNKCTHSIKVSHESLYDIYDQDTMITTTCISKKISPDEFLNTIFGAMQLLNDYTVFIESIIVKYYADLYEKFCSRHS